jgi:hypothetical protein
MSARSARKRSNDKGCIPRDRESNCDHKKEDAEHAETVNGSPEVSEATES